MHLWVLDRVLDTPGGVESTPNNERRLICGVDLSSFSNENRFVVNQVYVAIETKLLIPF